MKKVFLIAAAVVALAACSKNEVLPSSSSINNEISFNVAPRTKAGPETFDTHNVFASWAYYLPKGSSWDSPAASVTPQEYIKGRTISYVGGVWKEDGKTYYWPKDGGSLTFFAYSLNRDNLTLTGGDSHFTCDAVTGISGAIDLMANKNTDFMVADIAKDKTANESAHSFNGVPTLFKHKLSKVACTVKKASDYPNVKFELNKIEFLSVSHYATYGQFVNDGAGTIKEVITPGRKDTQVYTSATQEITSTATPVAKANEDVVIYIPQTFADETAKIKVTYTITTTVEGSTTPVVQTVEREYPIKNQFDEWAMGKRYIFNLTFSLDEITWAPAVEPWVDVTSGTTVDVK